MIGLRQCEGEVLQPADPPSKKFVPQLTGNFALFVIMELSTHEKEVKSSPDLGEAPPEP
jgi:hypothetical protein